MKKWLGLSIATTLCLIVWGYFIFSIISTDGKDQKVNFASEVNKSLLASKEYSEIVIKQDNETAEFVDERKAKRPPFLEDIRVRGLHKGDLSDIAPDGIIAIDDLLAIINE